MNVLPAPASASTETDAPASTPVGVTLVVALLASLLLWASAASFRWGPLIGCLGVLLLALSLVLAGPKWLKNAGMGVGLLGAVSVIPTIIWAATLSPNAGTEVVQGVRVDSACADRMRDIEDKAESMLYHSGGMGTLEYIRSGGSDDRLVLLECEDRPD